MSLRQYQVEVDPRKLEYYGISLDHVMMAVRHSTGAAGGRVLELGETEYMVRNQAYIGDLEDLRNVPVHKPPNAPPVLLSDVADIHLGPDMRLGLADLDGEGETVGGIVVIRYGENARDVISRVKAKLEDLKAGLPPGVQVVTTYDRSALIDRATGNLRDTLIEEILIVALVALVFLLHVRSTLIAVVTLPIGVGVSLLIMHLAGINANIMSLGGIAIAIGVMIDASLVTVENVHKHLERDAGQRTRLEIILAACKEVGPALFFSLLIVTVSFLPVLALEGQSGRLFKPLAYTKTFAMAAGAVLAVTLVPALTALFLRGKTRAESQNPISRFFIAAYRPVIHVALRRRWLILVATVIVLAATIIPVMRLGSEFMPPLYEGDLLYMPTTLPGISIAKARELLQQTDRIIKSFPEVERVFGKAGRAETATDPAPLTMLETTIKLKPQDQWRPGLTPDMLIDSLDAAIRFPGLTNSWTMPIRTRIDMLATGIKTPVGIKIMGPDLDSLNSLAERVEAAIKPLAGVRSVYAERVTGGHYLDVDIDRFKAAAYGLTVADIQKTLATAVGGMNIAYNVEGRERYPISVRYPRDLRETPEELARVLIDAPDGRTVPLGQVATLKFTDGAMMIKSEDARLTAWVFVDLRNIDVGSFVTQARARVNSAVSLPTGYSLVWSGQYESMQEVARKLQLIIPVTLFIILLLLYLQFRNLTDSLIVLLSLPFALVGGIWLFYLFGFNTSVAVYVGFIALAGVAAETGIVMLVYLEEAVARYRAEGRLRTFADLHDAVVEGAVERVRPKLMTVLTDILSLLPVIIGAGTGSEVMHRIATPLVGGMVSSTLLTLVVIPVLFFVVRSRAIRTAANV